MLRMVRVATSSMMFTLHAHISFALFLACIESRRYTGACALSGRVMARERGNGRERKG